MGSASPLPGAALAAAEEETEPRRACAGATPDGRLDKLPEESVLALQASSLGGVGGAPAGRGERSRRGECCGNAARRAASPDGMSGSGSTWRPTDTAVCVGTSSAQCRMHAMRHRAQGCAPLQNSSELCASPSAV